MKKLAAILAVTLALCVPAFADKSKFYGDGKIIDTMFVDSPEGLRVRERPSLKSARICGLCHRMSVKVVALGREETIDGITAPWVEILIPRYEWKGFEPEYGWVFGGYLNKAQRPFSTKGWTNADFRTFLSKCNWIVDSDEPHPRILVFERDGSFKKLFAEMGAGAFGKWGADFPRRRITTVSAMEVDGDDDYPFVEKTEVLDIGEIDEFAISLNNERFVTECDFWTVASEETLRTTDKDSSMFNSNVRSCLLAFYSSPKLFASAYRQQKKFRDKYIRYGLCHTDDEEYMKSFRAYWNPIMAERQKEADSAN